MSDLIDRQKKEGMDFEKIVKMYKAFRNELIAFAKKCDVSKEDSEDIVHDLFARLMEKGMKILSIELERSFLYRCIRNDCLNFKKSAGQSKTRRIEDNDEFRDQDDIEEKMKAEEEKRAIKKAIKKLPDIYKGVIELRLKFGSTNKEIAEKFGITEEAVESRIRRGFSMLQEPIKFLRE